MDSSHYTYQLQSTSDFTDYLMWMFDESFYYFGVFFTSAILNYLLYKLVDVYMFEVTDGYPLQPVHRQKYIAKNVAKSMLLMILTVISIYTAVLPMVFRGEWSTHVLRMIAATYGSMDFIGLLCVPKLPQTTKVHHVVSTVLIWSSFLVDFTLPNVSTLFATYALLSMFAGSVNMYLGLRFLGSYNKLRLLAMWNYIICCAVNWTLLVFTVAIHWFGGHFSATHVVVLILMLGLVRDDLILIKWLYDDEKHLPRDRK
jgi:hypothetical protein